MSTDATAVARHASSAVDLLAPPDWQVSAPAFEYSAAPASPDADTNARHFKQMHYCMRCMTAVLERYGLLAVQREDYRRAARLRQELRDRIAADNLGLVYSLCKRNRLGTVDGDELLSEGLAALVRTIETFDPWSGYRFSTYACSSILHAFYRCAKREAGRRRHESYRFDSTLEGRRWRDTRRDEDSRFYRERLKEILAAGTARLTEIEADVLSQRFPLDPEVAPLTLCNIGHQLNLSKERVRQLQNTGLAKLRAALECDPALRGEYSAVGHESPVELQSVSGRDSLRAETHLGSCPAGAARELRATTGRPGIPPAHPGWLAHPCSAHPDHGAPGGQPSRPSCR